MSLEVEQAIYVVAQAVAANLLEDVGPLWEDYPEIGEQDWLEIVKMVSARLHHPGPDLFNTAYELLASRAERDA